MTSALEHLAFILIKYYWVTLQLAWALYCQHGQQTDTTGMQNLLSFLRYLVSPSCCIALNDPSVICHEIEHPVTFIDHIAWDHSLHLPTCCGFNVCGTDDKAWHTHILLYVILTLYVEAAGSDTYFFTGYGLAWNTVSWPMSMLHLIAGVILVLRYDFLDVRSSYSHSTVAHYDRDLSQVLTIALPLSYPAICSEFSVFM